MQRGRGLAKFGERLLVSFCENDVPDGAVRKRAVVEGVAWVHSIDNREETQLAVNAQARLPRCSSVCGCIIRFLLRSGPAAEVSIPRFCQSLLAPQPTAGDSDIGTAWPTTDGLVSCSRSCTSKFGKIIGVIVKKVSGQNTNVIGAGRETK